MTDDKTIIREWAAQLGWEWPADAATPPGVHEAIGQVLDVSKEYVRAVYNGRVPMPAVWASRWAAAMKEA